MGNMFCCVQVDESTVAFKERFGKLDEVLEPGCHFVPWILGYRLAGNLSLRLQQLDVKCETKTKDNVLVNVVASVQYRALADKAIDAFYKLSNPRSQIQAYVTDVIRASVAKLNLDDPFGKNIAKAVEDELAQVMSAYGYEIVRTLIIEAIPDERVKQAMAEIYAAKWKAKAEAESNFLSGSGTAIQRQVIVDGFENSVLGFSVNVPGTTVNDIVDMVLTDQYLDAIKEMGATSRSSVIFIPHGPGVVRDVGTQILYVLLQASTSQ